MSSDVKIIFYDRSERVLLNVGIKVMKFNLSFGFYFKGVLSSGSVGFVYLVLH